MTQTQQSVFRWSTPLGLMGCVSVKRCRLTHS